MLDGVVNYLGTIGATRDEGNAARPGGFLAHNHAFLKNMRMLIFGSNFIVFFDAAKLSTETPDYLLDFEITKTQLPFC